MHALRVIEWEAIQQQLTAECDTTLGQALASSLTPFFHPDEIRIAIETTAEADSILAEIPLTLVGIRDISGPVKLASKGGVLDGSVLHQIGTSLRVMRTLRGNIESRKEQSPHLWRLAINLPELQSLEDKLLLSLDADGEVCDSASNELASLRQRVARMGQKIQERIQSYVSGRSRDLLSDAVVTTRDGRYVVPLKSENKGKIKGIVHDTSASGATIYIEPEDVVALGNELRQAEAAERAEVQRILTILSARSGEHADEIITGIDASEKLDLIIAKARLGHRMKGCVPLITTGSTVKLVNARHPLLPSDSCIPLSIELGATSDGSVEIDVLLITGPNTGGKTVAIKTVGLCIAMAQSGLMPPAGNMRIGCFTQIWADIGDEQSLAQSLSTFSGHIKNIATAIQELQPGALVLLDEVGAGTDPTEGSALARALLLSFQRKGAKVMASTHYGELKLLASNAPGFINSSMEFDTKSLRPTYRLLIGVPGSSQAFKIASKYGISQEIIDEAQSGISSSENDLSAVIEKLTQTQKRAQKAQSEADRLAHRLREVELEAEEKIQKAEELRSRVRERAGEELETLLREIRLEAADIFDQLKKNPNQEGFDRARQRLKELQDVGQDFVRDTKPKAPKPQANRILERIEKGMTVAISGLNQTGIVLEEPKGKQVLVQAGALKMTCKLADLTPIKTPNQSAPKPKVTSMMIKKAMNSSTEIHLRHMRAEDAQLELDKFVDEAVLGGVGSIRIVHGKGEGVLRKITQDTLRRHKEVRSYRIADAEEGGEGVTIAILN